MTDKTSLLLLMKVCGMQKNALTNDHEQWPVGTSICSRYPQPTRSTAPPSHDSDWPISSNSMEYTEMPSHYCINFIFLNLRAILSDLHATCHVPAISQVSIIFHVHPTHHPIICFHLLSRSAIFLQPLITHFLLRLFTHISAIRPCFIAMINGSSPSFPINARHGPVHVNTLIQHLARVPIIMLSFILTYF